MNPPQPTRAYQDQGPARTPPLSDNPTPAPPAPSQGEADHALLRRMAAGDETALGALYDRWSPLLHSVILRIVGSHEDAEEVLDEMFWQAWRQAGRYQQSRASVSTWLTMMARSRAVDLVRSRGRFHPEAGEELTERSAVLADGEAAGPLETAEAGERRRLVLAALDGLPAEQRATVELAYFRGMSQSEIAAFTGEPLGTVKTRARLALQKLRETLRILHEDDEP